MNVKFAERIEPITTKNTSMAILETLADLAREEGEQSGEKKALLSTAKKMLKDGVRVSLVYKYTGIPVTQLNKLVKRA